MQFIRYLKEISKSDVLIAGGKGASLGEMIQARIPVPEGYVVLSNAFEQFIKETDLNVEIDAILDTVKHEEVHTMEEASEKIQSLILNTEIPNDIEKEISNSFNKLGADFVAVRSSATSEDSATAAWAGQLDSFLNTTKKDLLENVKRCWASLFTPRAIFYRFEKKLHGTAISVAVVVQKMVNSEESGIAFSVHPVTQDYNQLIIEAGFGLGEAIVQGAITPDSYVVDKQDWHIIDINVNEQSRGLFKAKDGGNKWIELGEKGKEQVLSEKEIIELAKLIVKIEKHYGFPCDIEWAIEKGKFYIVQSRPITTITSENKTENKDFEYIKEIIRRYELKPATHRELPLFTLSCIAFSYTKLLRKQLGFSYEKIGAIGGEGKFHIMFNEKHIIDETEKLVEAHLDSLDKIAFSPAQKIASEVDKKINEMKKLIKESPLEVLKEIAKIYPEYTLSITVYNCFWRYIGNENNKGKLSVEDVEKISKERDVVAKIYPQVEKIINECVNLVGINNNFDGDLLRYFTLNEMNEYLYAPILSEETKQKLIDRRKGYYFLYIENPFSERVWINKEVISLITNSFFNVNKDIETFQGFGAYGGIVSGEVINLKTHLKHEISNIKDYIIVTSMTKPDDSIIIKNAKAIITDEGGILSHAVIIAREMKKPCIVGTKIATQVLKDGDIVEVNADKGVIKIIKKA